MKLIIPQEVEAKIHDYVMSVDSEIAGMGKVRIIDPETVIVEEVMIYEQTVTEATADLSPQAIAKWQTALVKAGESPKNWRLWWHSHDTMPAFFSARDTATIDDQSEGDWMISLVVNKRRERQARLDLYRPFRMFMDKLEIQIGDGVEVEYTVPADIAAEVALKVKRPPAPKYLGMGYGTQSKPIATPYGLPESEYTRDQLISIVKTMERQVDDYTDQGGLYSDESIAVQNDLVDMYYELASVELNKTVAAEVRAKAVALENMLYNMEQGELTF